MIALDITQGTPEWLALRRHYFTASEAASMLNNSPYRTRSALLRQKTTGLVPEVAGYQQAIFDRGHAAENAARPVAEAMIREDLYPVTGTLEVAGLKLLASFDGLTLDESVAWENKMPNAKLSAYLTDFQDLPDTHWPQVEQQLLISGAEKCIFTVSDGSESTPNPFWYVSKPERRQALIAGWQQFSEDLAAYVPIESPPVPLAAPIDDLPALSVELVGQVTRSNLASFKTTVLARIQAISTDLNTDSDFATAEKMVKFLDEGEKRLTLVKSQALAQTASIDELFRTIDSLQAEMKAKRLTLDKLVKARKDSIRYEIVRNSETAFIEHLGGLSRRLAKVKMPTVKTDFAGVIKNKRSIDSLRDAAASELARAKIDANALADKIQRNLQTLDEHTEFAFLFADLPILALKEDDDLKAVIASRIAAHQAVEAQRIAAEAAVNDLLVATQRPTAAPVIPPVHASAARPTADLLRDITSSLGHLNYDDLTLVQHYIQSLTRQKSA